MTRRLLLCAAIALAGVYAAVLGLASLVAEHPIEARPYSNKLAPVQSNREHEESFQRNQVSQEILNRLRNDPELRSLILQADLQSLRSDNSDPEEALMRFMENAMELERSQNVICCVPFGDCVILDAVECSIPAQYYWPRSY